MKITKFSKWIENTVGKGEIASYKQFLLFPQCFQKACFPGTSKGVIVWEWVNPEILYFNNTRGICFFEEIEGKDEKVLSTCLENGPLKSKLLALHTIPDIYKSMEERF